jgi:hypothetical protein
MKNRLRDKKSNLTKWVGSIYARIALHPHEYLSQHSNGYRRWHNFRFHKQVHIAIVSLAGLAVVLIIIGGITHNVFAFSSWIQSNWSGGLGSSTTNQYSAASNVTTSTPNQITLAQTNVWGSSFSAWKYRQQVTFNNTSANLGVTPDTLNNFPVLVELNSSNFNFSHAQPLGQDIRFTASDGNTALNYQIESWNSTNKLAYIWVSVPDIDAGSTTDSVYMYYGNSYTSDAQNKTGVWNSGYAGVWHLNEASGNNSDSTINNNTGVVEGNPTRITTGKIFGNAHRLCTGSSDDNDVITAQYRLLAIQLHMPLKVGSTIRPPVTASYMDGWRRITRG